tara:strand:- start:14625 stop:15887 length:1263 start_codon:yes stop_codon:yes gene_type:complete
MAARTIALLLCGFALHGCGPSQSSIPASEPTKPAEHTKREPASKADDVQRGECTEAELAGSPDARAAFEAAEAFYHQEFMAYTIDAAPENGEQTKELLGQLVQLGNRARDNYLKLGKYRRSMWSVPSMVRLGDVAHEQARKILSMPIPEEIRVLDAKHPSMDILVQYNETVANVVLPLLKQARTHWKEAVDTSEGRCTEDKWTALARKQLATTTLIDSVRTTATTRKARKSEVQPKPQIPEPAEAPAQCRGTALDLIAVFEDASCTVAGPTLPLPINVTAAFSPTPLLSRKGEASGALVLTNSSGMPVELRLSPFGASRYLNQSASIYDRNGKQVNKRKKRASCSGILASVGLRGSSSAKRFVLEPNGTARLPINFSTRTQILDKDCRESSGQPLPKGNYTATIRFGFLDGDISGPLRIR